MAVGIDALFIIARLNIIIPLPFLIFAFVAEERTAIVKFSQGRIWFNPNTSIPISDSNLPLQNCTVTDRPFYWEITPLGFQKENGTLKVAITNYEPANQQNWKGVAPKSPISFIAFSNLSWEGLSIYLSSYNQNAKANMLHSAESKELSPLHEATLQVKVRLSDLEFHQGYVSFSKEFRWSEQLQTIRIENKHIFPEIKYLLPYVAKLLKKKTINAVLKVGRKDGQTQYIKCSSDEISQLNESSLRVIRISCLEDARKRLFQAEGNNIFDPSLDSIDDLLMGNIDSFEKDLLLALIEKGEVRNAQQLQHLSTLLPEDEKLYLTIDPQFGFVFKIIGEEMTHFVWELADSHATYIWTFPEITSSSKQLNILKHEFSMLATHGRSYYKESFENKDDLYLRVVKHATQSNPMVDQFYQWRMKVERLLI